VLEVAATAAAVTIYFDALKVTAGQLRERLGELASRPSGAPQRRARCHRIPVRYGGEDGPDLLDVARWAGLSPDEIVRRHSAVDYHVYAMGFAPGFPYLGIVPPECAMPRLSTPRKLVPAGAVGVAGSQTGIYPSDGPGGWRIIGRTSVQLFSPAIRRPFLMAPGDSVRFVPVLDNAKLKMKN
jgi:KipI family sensor histidine kinase inhibitor